MKSWRGQSSCRNVALHHKILWPYFARDGNWLCRCHYNEERKTCGRDIVTREHAEAGGAARNSVGLERQPGPCGRKLEGCGPRPVFRCCETGGQTSGQKITWQINNGSCELVALIKDRGTISISVIHRY